MCFKKGELRIGSQDLLLGVVEGTPFYVGPVQYHYLADTDMTLDVVPGDLDRFSPESPKGVHFISQSEHPAPESML